MGMIVNFLLRLVYTQNMKKIFSILSALSILVLFSTEIARASTGAIAMNVGYYKGNGAYDVVVREIPGNKLRLYVNDKNPVTATTNGKGWATFRHVRLNGSGKISFTTIYVSGKHQTERPINYARQFNVANNKVSFSVPAAPKVATQPTVAPAPTPAPTNTGTSNTALSNNNTYVNSDGNTVHSPAASTDGSVPAGATAQCRDGSYSFSQHRSGTCSGHGGVARWL
jgi:hypothetical protein